MSNKFKESDNVTSLSKKSAEKSRQYWWSGFYAAGARQSYFGEGTVCLFKLPTMVTRQVELCLTEDNRQYCKI